ncbi:MAG: hypothetical protein HDQ91_07705 [Desulfovibrio sp.]|nr:hypothetical protein [Desulfovibrio sp.]
MPEIYEIEISGSAPVFRSAEIRLPDYVFSARFDPTSAPGNVSVVCRMGAPDECHCVIFRMEKEAGGIFALHDSGEIMFVAVAKTNLAYAIAKGFFGELIANSRSGLEIFEQMGDEDD